MLESITPLPLKPTLYRVGSDPVPVPAMYRSGAPVPVYQALLKSG